MCHFFPRTKESMHGRAIDEKTQFCCGDAANWIRSCSGCYGLYTWGGKHSQQPKSGNLKPDVHSEDSQTTPQWTALRLHEARLKDVFLGCPVWHLSQGAFSKYPEEKEGPGKPIASFHLCLKSVRMESGCLTIWALCDARYGNNCKMAKQMYELELHLPLFSQFMCSP